MPSSYTTSLRLVLPVTGELVGTWGDVTNAGLTALVDSSVAGTAAVTMTDANYTLTTANGAADESRQMFVTLTGTLSVARDVICPTASKLYFVTNNTTGGFSIVFKTSAGTGVTVPNGFRAILYCNGTNVVSAANYQPALALGTALPLASGGTGATTADTALTNFGGTTVGKAVFTAATVLAAQQAMDVEIGVDVQAFDADTAKTDVTQSFTAAQRGAVVALTDGATITPDFATGNNFSVTLGGSRTLANPTNIVAGQSGSVFVSQDGTGGRTLAYGSNWDFAGGVAPSLTTGANAVDRIDYVVRSGTSIQAVFTGNYS